MVKQVAYFIGVAIFLLAFTSCNSSDKHFLTDKKYREEVHQKFLERKELAKNRTNELFSVFDNPELTTEEIEALEFLYAYMPLSDLADYDGEFFLRQVRGAFEAREYFDWGKKIPDEVFRHFVLVYRVNTENLDDARIIFFHELKNRVRGLTMEEAVLEVNHWCHEKITYRATDGRTSAPLDLMRTSWGRCGEQSTFTTMALRSVGIPARQCYTPRWVHTDSNHAWVEAWVDGTWRYIGASEPEAELDIAWFNAPVKRAMMVHTNVFGKYTGTEDKTLDSDLYSIINILSTYTDTRALEVSIVDDVTNEPVEGATVKFEVYNYSQFYPIATLKSDGKGKASITSNAEGDVWISAHLGDKYDYKKVEQNSAENTLRLRNNHELSSETAVMHVPREQKVKELSKEQIASNAIRLAHEDSIRNAYMSTFISDEDARKFANDFNLQFDRVWHLLSSSQGNWREISAFMRIQNENPLVLDYLESLSEKDLRDTSAENLNHHFSHAKEVGIKEGTPKGLYASAIYSPRISVELIRPWRSYFQEILPNDFILKAQVNPQELVRYVKENIRVTDTENYYNCPVSPQGVFEMKLADSRSRDILFVAMARSMGIASRLEPATARPQYHEGNQWKDVLFETVETELPKGRITFTNDEQNIIKPAYSNHYTIACLQGGEYKTLNLRSDVALQNLPGTITVDAGFYRLTVGSRANDGSVTFINKYFDLAENETVKQEISLPQPQGLIQVQGIVDPNTIVLLDSGDKSSLKELMNGKGIMLCFSDPDREPTKHILQDLPQVREALEEWGGGILFLVPDDKLSSAFDVSAFKGLPQQAKWSTDDNRVLLNSTAEALQLDFSNNFPLVIYLNTNGGVLFSSQGYRIGIGESIIETIETEKRTRKE